MRSFIALCLSKRFTDETAEMARMLKGQVEGRFAPRENYHLTLAFLGDINNSQLTDVCEALDIAAERTEPIMISAEGLGTFGKKDNATLWLGIKATSELNGLAEAVRTELKTRYIDFDAKAFKPHLTLARHASVSQGILSVLPFPNDTQADTVAIFKSTLERTGAHYKLLHSATLASNTHAFACI